MAADTVVLTGSHTCRFTATAGYRGTDDGTVTRVGDPQALEHFVAGQAWQVEDNPQGAC